MIDFNNNRYHFLIACLSISLLHHDLYFFSDAAVLCICFLSICAVTDNENLSDIFIGEDRFHIAVEILPQPQIPNIKMYIHTVAT